jgi:L-cysteine:1D-myo-inositol 2-amino-2-deoxy-alpha-D-glucopyranoside ligase
MVGSHGEKMSKSRGNLVFVSALRAAGVDPMAIRLALLAHHYRSDWEWTEAELTAAATRLERWRAALSGAIAPPPDDAIAEIRTAMADDLDAPRALSAMDAWAGRTLSGPQHGEEWPEGEPGVMARVVDALLGVRL